LDPVLIMTTDDVQKGMANEGMANAIRALSIDGVEAGVRQGWDAIIGPEGAFIGMHSFGASGKYKDLYEHFGITAEKVAEAAVAKLQSRG
jgi:transketolase